jgi:hypothetical protein
MKILLRTMVVMIVLGAGAQADTITSLRWPLKLRISSQKPIIPTSSPRLKAVLNPKRLDRKP